MKRTWRPLGGVLAATLTVTLAACGGVGGRDGNETGGITDTKVIIGTSGPITGPFAGVGLYIEGARAYFDYVNKVEGGVKMADGKTRKIDFKVADDVFDPARTLENARRFVDKDKGFAMFMIQGTPTGLAARQYLNDSKVPNLIYSGASDFSGDKKFPWTLGFPMAYVTESAIIADLVKKENPDARVATLALNISSGVQFMEGFEGAVEGTGIKIVDKQTFEGADPSIDSQLTNILKSKPDVILEFSNGKFVSQALKGLAEADFKGQHYINSTGSTVSNLEPAGLEKAEGLTSVQWAKDPSDPQWADDADITKYKEILAKYRPSAPTNDLQVMYGFVGAELLVDALKRTDTDPQSLVDAWSNFDGFEPMGMLDGVSIMTSPDDPFLIESAYAQHFSNGVWKTEGQALDTFEGSTPVK